jgi:hypothetical protein
MFDQPNGFNACVILNIITINGNKKKIITKYLQLTSSALTFAPPQP